MRPCLATVLYEMAAMPIPYVKTFLILLVSLVVVALLGCSQEVRQVDHRGWQIIFESERDGHREIYVMDPDGSNQQRLTYTPGTGEGSWSARWSPDRTRIAFTSTREGDLNEIYVMDADGSNVQRLTRLTPGKESANPSWSLDGRRIAFESGGDGNSDIYVMDADGSNVHTLTHTKGTGKASENPDWSPDGRSIAFEFSGDGKYEIYDIYTVGTDGSNVHQLTHRPRTAIGNWRPRWSPDGKRIAFSSGGKRDYEIYTINADGSDLRRLTRNSGKGLDNRHPDWSPDGRKIVFQSTRDGKSKIDWLDPNERGSWYHSFEMYVMDGGGSNVKRLTFNQAWDGHPDW